MFWEMLLCRFASAVGSFHAAAPGVCGLRGTRGVEALPRFEGFNVVKAVRVVHPVDPTSLDYRTPVLTGSTYIYSNHSSNS